MKLSLIITAVFFQFIDICFAQQLEFKIFIENNSYIKYEPVIVMYEIKNKSTQPVEISTCFGGNPYECMIYDEKNNPLKKYEALNINGYMLLNTILQPNEAIYHFHEISDSYGNNDDNYSSRNSFKVGKYRIRLQYLDALIEGKDTLRQNIIESNEIEFSVIEPQQKDKYVMNSFLNLYKDRFNLGEDKFNNGLLDLIYTYKDSPYISLIGRTYLQFKGKLNEQAIKLFLDFPSSYWSVMHCSLFWNYNLSIYKNYDSELKGTLLEKNLMNWQIRRRDLEKYKSIYRDLFLNDHETLKNK
jgi:hypothetical protein